MTIDEIPDNNVYTGREMKRILRAILEGTGDVVVTTTEASELLGHSPDWWRREAPEVGGAYQETDGGPWSLPLSGCREHLRRRRKDGKLRRRAFGKQPWKGRPAPQIVRSS